MPARNAARGEGPDADLDVVIVNYNAGEYLERCVSSILRAAGDLRVEILVVDNASEDGSARAVAEAHAEIRLIENPDNRGLSAAWNQGIRSTRAPWVFLPNPDVEIWEGTLDTLVALGEARPEVAVMGPLVRNADGTLYPSGRGIPNVPHAVAHAFLGPFRPGNRFTRAYRLDGWDRESERQVDWVSGSCMFVRRSAIEEVGLFDERFFLYAEELDLSTRLRGAGWKILFTPEVEVLHEGGVSTGRSRKMLLMHSKGVYRYFVKHRARGWRRVLLPFAWLALRTRAEIVAIKERGER